MIVRDDHLPRGLWKLGKTVSLIKRRDGQVRLATVKMASRNRQQLLLRRPMQLLYPLEVSNEREPDEDVNAANME